MKPRLILALAAGAALVLSANAAFAQLTASVDSYRFLPRLSVINQTGGIAGVNINYRVEGTFDLRLEPSPLAVFPPIHIPSFENAEVTGKNPNHSDLDVDLALNLEGLDGRELLLPRLRGFYHFRGESGDGSSVELFAKKFGRWFYVRGGTTPPPGSADFFEFRIRGLARQVPDADMNGDGVVDGADLAVWARGDALSGGDFLAWQRQAGDEPPSMDVLDAELEAAISGAASPIPEPATLLIAAIGGGMLLAFRRR